MPCETNGTEEDADERPEEIPQRKTEKEEGRQYSQHRDTDRCSRRFCGFGFSAGGKYIMDTARGKQSTTTWRRPRSPQRMTGFRWILTR